MFTNGTPIESTYHVQNGNLRTCGEIAAVSIAQGGPPPCFLEPCAFHCIFEDVDMVDIRDDHLTVSEMTLIEELKNSLLKMATLGQLMMLIFMKILGL